MYSVEEIKSIYIFTDILRVFCYYITNELAGDIMVLASPPRPPVNPDEK